MAYKIKSKKTKEKKTFAIRNWKRVEDDEIGVTYINKLNKNKEIEISKGNKIWTTNFYIHNPTAKYSRLVKGRKFKTKPEALAYAKNYMVK
ncbi:MAG TPA: hypothetical protein VMZ91_13510 [Candidatus Paceibacterota bacterium]|nr:hypothetical protein [Candidatus Paceibacterota bacterium]